jgi:hypothetical protein
MILGAWRTAKKLEKLCFATILLNLSTVVLFLVVVWP